jgi:hypothetical protein
MNFVTNKKGWPSEHTRGYQIAEYLGCGINRAMRTFDETTIAVKCVFSRKVQQDLDSMTNLWMDLIDDVNTINFAKRLPHVGIIAITDIMKDYLAQHIDNKIVVIPEHTCNFNNEIRKRKTVKVVGYVGSRNCFDLDATVVEEALKKIGLEFKYLICETDDVTREAVVEFYKSIDIQLAFRTEARDIRNPMYRNPLKVFNAGSFKVPTVAYPEVSYRICAGTMFLEATTLGSVIDKCYQLKNDKSLYDFYANRAYEWSKQFSIKNIAKLYMALAPDETFDVN